MENIIRDKKDSSSKNIYFIAAIAITIILILVATYQTFKYNDDTQDNILYNYKFIDLELSKNYTSENITMTLEDKNVSFIYEQYNQTEHEISMFITHEDHDNKLILVFPLAINASIIDDNEIDVFDVAILYDYGTFAYTKDSEWIEYLKR